MGVKVTGSGKGNGTGGIQYGGWVKIISACVCVCVFVIFSLVFCPVVSRRFVIICCLLIEQVEC